MEDKIALYKFLEGIKDKFLFIFKENSEEIEIIIAIHKIQNKELRVVFNNDLDYSKLNEYLIHTNVLIIKNIAEEISLNLIDIPIFYYEDTLKTFSIQDKSLDNLKLLIEEKIEEDNKNKTIDIFDEKNILKTLGLRIRKIRMENNYTQENFSELIGISPNFLSDVERGKKSLSIEKILFLCKVLNIDLNNLFLNIELKETDGIVLGKNKDEKIILSNDDRKIHTLILGQAGCGKSNLIKKYIKEDMKKNNSIVVIEPKGNLIHSLMLNSDKDSTIYFDALYGNYYLDIFKNETSFIIKLLVDAFNIDNYTDNKLIKYFLNKTLEIMKKNNINSTDYFTLILNQEISNYGKNNDDLKMFLNTVTMFFQNKLVKTSFNVDTAKNELVFEEFIKNKKLILINTYYAHLRGLHEIYSNLILSYYINSVNSKDLIEDFQSLYIDEIQCYDSLIKNFILNARASNIGITMTSQSIDIVDRNILLNTKNFIVFNSYLSHKDNIYLSSIFKFNIEKNNNCFYHIIKDLSVVENGYFEIT